MEQPSDGLATVLAFLQRFGEVMGGLVLGALYFVLLGPVAVVSRVLSDPLRLRRPSGSAFVEWDDHNETVGAAQRQG